MFIPDPDLEFLHIADPGVKNASDPGSAIGTNYENSSLLVDPENK
jgi:hypothetical protein